MKIGKYIKHIILTCKCGVITKYVLESETDCMYLYCPECGKKLQGHQRNLSKGYNSL